MSLRWLVRGRKRFLKLRDYRSGSRIVGDVCLDGEYWTGYLQWNSQPRRPLGMSKREPVARRLVERAVQSEVLKDARLNVLKDQYWRGEVQSDGVPRL
jgi:hypothetical protein